MFAVGTSEGTIIIWDLMRGVVKTELGSNDDGNPPITEKPPACRQTLARMDFSSTWVISIILSAFTMQAWPWGVYIWQIGSYL